MGDMTPWRLLDRRDQEWRPSLAGVSLAAEIDIDPLESGSALVSLGIVYGRNKDATEGERTRLLARWPACLVVGMSGVAAVDYEEGTYWQKLWDAAGYQASPKDQSLWGRAFLKALDTLRLPSFPGATQRFLGPILMHSGIPTYCLGDLLRMLVDHSGRDPGLDADSFIQWATAGTNRMRTLDKPVQHLIEYGGEYAYDIIDRILDLLDRLREPRPDLFGIGLPERLIAETRRVKNLGFLGSISGPRRSADRSGTGRPRLTLDPFGEGPRILLPATRQAWRLVVDGQPHHIRTARGWPEEDTTATSFPLPGPARHVQVGPPGDTQAAIISVVRDSDPLLVFSEDGEFLPPGRPLPPDVAWILFPDARRLRHEGELREVSEALLPFGWQGWTLLAVDLTDCRSLGLTAGGTRDVRGSAGPRLQLPEPLTGITAAHQMPVYGAAPLISLPSDRPRTWYIEVRALDERSTAKPVRMTERSGVIDPWASLPRPVTGTFEVDILGPLGFRLHRRVTVAEGLSVRYEPGVRLFTDNGLDPATATLNGRAVLSDTRIVFGPDRRQRAITYGSERLVVTPPHISVLHDNQAGGARWSSTPLLLQAEPLAQGTAGTLLIRAPAELRLPWLQVTGTGISQEIRPRGVSHPGQARYPLAQITDTVAAVGRLDLQLRIQDRLVPAAFVRPKALATEARRSRDTIKLVNCAGRSGLHAGIYAVYEPWREAAVVPVRSDATFVIPAHLRDAGPLRILPAAQDASASWPHWPPVSDSLLVRSPLGTDSAPSLLSAFLAGRGPCPPSISNERMWLLVTLADQLRADGAREDLRAQCAMRLRSYPVAALLDLARTTLNPAEAVIELIRAGLGSLQLLGSIDIAVARQMWGRLRPVAALLSGSILADPGQMRDLVELITQDHGAAVADMLTGDADPYEPSDDSGQPMSLPPQLVAEAVELIGATPYRQLTARINARPEGPARASAALALAMRTAARSGGRRDFRRKYRAYWVDLARAEPHLVSLDIIAAQAAIAGIDRRSQAGK
jgi:hypothetical protein